MAVKKALFKTQELESQNNEGIETFLKKVEVEIQVENNLSTVEKEMHERRLNKMKQVLDDSSKDDWKYEKIEHLIRF